MSNIKSALYASLEALIKAETITRKELAYISRDALVYVPDTDDIGFINRLLGVLTPVNRRVAIVYFTAFLPWDAEHDAEGNFIRFGKRHSGAKSVKRKMDKIADWLADEASTIWTWSDKNIEIKKKDFAGRIDSAIRAALKGDEKSDTPPLSKVEVMMAVIQSGLNISDVMEGAAQVQKAQEAAEAVMNVEKDEAEAEVSA